MSAHPAKTITAAALAGAAFALAYKATSRYLGGANAETMGQDVDYDAVPRRFKFQSDAVSFSPPPP